MDEYFDSYEIEEEKDEDSTADGAVADIDDEQPWGPGLPPWLAGAADEMATRPRTPSVGSDVSMTPSEAELEELRKKRRRYVEDEAEELDT